MKHFNERYTGILPLDTIIDKKCNATLRLVSGVQDDQGLPRIAMKQFIDYAPQADVVLGPVLSRTTVPVAVGAAALNLPQISFAASADELSDKSVYPNFFRLGASDAQTAQPIVALFKQFGYKKVGLIFVSNAFGLSIKSALMLECRKQGIQLYSQEYDDDITGVALEKQALRALQTMKTFRLNVIIYTAVTFEFMWAMSKASKDLDWWRGKLYVTHSIASDTGTLTTAQVQEGYRFLHGSLYVVPDVDGRLAGAVNLLNDWKNFDPSYINPLLPSAFKLPGNYFRQGQERVATRAWAWAYDSVIALGLAACGTTTNLTDNLARVNFLGTSGQVRFDANSYDRSPEGFFYKLSNLLVNDQGTAYTRDSVATLSVSSGTWNFTRPVYYNNGGSIPPNDVDPAPIALDSIPYGAKIFGWIEASLAILATLATLIYLSRHRKERIMVESQPIFMGFLDIGCLLMSISIIALTIESDAGCMLFPWLFSSGLVLAMASLMVKSARIAIFWRHRGKIPEWKRIVGTRVLPLCMCIIVLIDLAILLAWQLVDPWVLKTIILDKDEAGNPTRESLVCSSDSTASTIFIGVLIGYMCVIALITGWVSFWVRNAPRRYHEAKMTAIAGVFMFQLFFMATPAAFAVWQMALPRFLVLSTMSFLLVIIILGTMFLPKIFKVRFLGTMAAKSARDTRRDRENKRITFIAKNSSHHSQQDGEKGSGSNPKRSQSPAPDVDADEQKPNSVQDNNSTGRLDLSASSRRVVGDWRLMILGIKSETDGQESHADDGPDEIEDSQTPEDFTPDGFQGGATLPAGLINNNNNTMAIV